MTSFVELLSDEDLDLLIIRIEERKQEMEVEAQEEEDVLEFESNHCKTCGTRLTAREKRAKKCDYCGKKNPLEC